ncbi:MAG: hypothetical protein KDM91_12165 [Verrucomicrobiae bacterium]|nr:hypothetical protein [Verrucomicrobiae bacterium]MCP5539767.1 hypothetical protein [Akkermansiaceae bacterium]MCP5551879.1 hypothetical protein [Akkermansiaceae bacterium]
MESTETNPNPGASAADDINPILREALEEGRPRYFRASGGAARGKSGRRDTERFADELMTLQECAQIIGERLEMHAIAFGVLYDGEETIAFRFDPNSNPSSPELVGGLVNRRMPMRELLAGLNHFLYES